MNFHDLFSFTSCPAVAPCVNPWVDSNIAFANVAYTDASRKDSFETTLVTGDGLQFEFTDGTVLEVIPGKNIYADEATDQAEPLQAKLQIAGLKLLDEDGEVIHATTLFTGSPLTLKFGDGAKVVITPTDNIVELAEVAS